MKIKAAIILMSGLMTSGCSLFVSHTQSVSARCSESDANLFINQETFTGFGSTHAPRNKSFTVMCTKEGFKPAIRSSGTTISGTGIADAIGSAVILLPGIGFLSPGAWKIEQSNINVVMERLPAP